MSLSKPEAHSPVSLMHDRTLRDLDYLHTGVDGSAVLDIDFNAVHAHVAKIARSHNKKIDPAALRWTPPI